jgi:uncharacterized protein (DUF362 family)
MKTCFISDSTLGYGDKPPFNPNRTFPEISTNITEDLGDNVLYDAFRSLLFANNCDIENYGKSAWNPVGYLIKPGHKVVLKPNWVFDVRGRKQFEQQLTTHGAFLRVVIDYVVIALNGKGKITICDAPLQSASFAGILEDNFIPDIIKVYSNKKDLVLEYLDLRREEMTLDASMSKIVASRILPGDPAGYTEIDLGPLSYLDKLCIENPSIRFSVGDYDDSITNNNHKSGVHKYLIPNTVLDCDVFINLPKMKTHKKTGITGALKNIIGINASKAYLAHCHKDKMGGDEFSKKSIKSQLAGFVDRDVKPILPACLWKYLRFAWRKYRDYILRSMRNGKIVDNVLLSSGGGWYGNKTLWRTIYDLNTIIFFADKTGKLNSDQQRGYLAIVDGIVACEGEGPLHGTTRKAGTIIMGDDPVSVDACMASIMGFDSKKTPIIAESDKIITEYKFSSYSGTHDHIKVNNSPLPVPFAAPSTWKDHIEKETD